jgi:hypothetical protein
MMITINNTVQQNTANLLTSEVGDELVMMDMDGGNYISLNRIGRVIWEMLIQPVLVSELIANLTLRFNIDEETCTTDTLEYLENMLAQKVISVK